MWCPEIQNVAKVRQGLAGPADISPRAPEHLVQSTQTHRSLILILAVFALLCHHRVSTAGTFGQFEGGRRLPGSGTVPVTLLSPDLPVSLGSSSDQVAPARVVTDAQTPVRCSRFGLNLILKLPSDHLHPPCESTKYLLDDVT